MLFPIGMSEDSDIQQIDAVTMDHIGPCGHGLCLKSSGHPSCFHTMAKLTEIVHMQKEDNITAQVRKYCAEGWPGYMPPNPLLKQHYTNRHFLVVDNLLLF